MCSASPVHGYGALCSKYAPGHIPVSSRPETHCATLVTAKTLQSPTELFLQLPLLSLLMLLLYGLLVPPPEWCLVLNDRVVDPTQWQPPQQVVPYGAVVCFQAQASPWAQVARRSADRRLDDSQQRLEDDQWWLKGKQQRLKGTVPHTAKTQEGLLFARWCRLRPRGSGGEKGAGCRGGPQRPRPTNTHFDQQQCMADHCGQNASG